MFPLYKVVLPLHLFERKTIKNIYEIFLVVLLFLLCGYIKAVLILFLPKGCLTKDCVIKTWTAKDMYTLLLVPYRRKPKGTIVLGSVRLSLRHIKILSCPDFFFTSFDI